MSENNASQEEKRIDSQDRERERNLVFRGTGLLLFLLEDITLRLNDVDLCIHFFASIPKTSFLWLTTQRETSQRETSLIEIIPLPCFLLLSVTCVSQSWMQLLCPQFPHKDSAQDFIISIKTRLSHIIISSECSPETSFILTKWKSSRCLRWNRSANLCVLFNFSSFQVRITDSF